MHKAKKDERMAATDLAAAKKDKAKDKRAIDITTMLTTGSEILKRFEQLGPKDL
jgi:hypothetical protein